VTRRCGAVVALDSIETTFESGRIVAVVGANGAGKSTLLRILAGLTGPDSGEVFLDGRRLDLGDLEMRRRIGFLPDFPGLFPEDSLLANLAITLRLYHADGPEAGPRVLGLLEELDLLTSAEMPAGTLSRGQAYKTALTGLIASAPDLWLLDEPLASGMDPRGLAVLRREMRAAARSGRTLLFTTQLVELAESLADTLLVLRNGAAVWQGPPGELRRAASAPGGEALADLLPPQEP